MKSKRNESTKRAVAVLAAVGLVIVLALVLTARVAARSGSGFGVGALHTTAPAAVVPAPRPIELNELPNPFCWSCSWNTGAALEFQVDLDLLAPLGNGTANAAEWFRDFALHDGKRVATEGKSVYRQRMVQVTIDGDSSKVLPGDDPLLLEAEPWVDQARCTFYPEVWQVDGVETPLPNLLMMLDLVRAWTARGKLSGDPQQAREDYRRAIRLGRMLRQDDVTIMQDLVAIAVIRIGAEALYELAREEGDAATMVVTALVMADKDAMRQLSARRISTFERAFAVVDPEAEELTLRLTDAEMKSIVDATRELTDRRFRMEGVIALHAVKQLGSPEQRTEAQALLDELSGGPDELLAQVARQSEEKAPDQSWLRELIRNMH